MKKTLIIGAILLSVSACTAIETQNKVTLKDGTQVSVGVAVEKEVTTTDGGF